MLVLLGAILVTDVVYRQQYSTFPAFLADHGLDARVFGLVVALNGGVILLLELPAAVALRERPALPVIGTGMVLVGAGYAALLLGAGIGSAVAMMILLSLGEILYKTTATAYMADQAPEHAIGRFQSLYAGVSVSGVVLGRRSAEPCTPPRPGCCGRSARCSPRGRVRRCGGRISGGPGTRRDPRDRHMRPVRDRRPSPVRFRI